MKKISKILFSILMAALLLCLSISTAFAVGDCTVNGKDASIGDTVVYTFAIEGSQQKIAGIHMVIFFDTDSLELKGVNADNLGSATINDNMNGDGQIVIVNSFVNGAAGLKCTEKTVLATATFEVKKSGNTEISYYIPYMYDIDLVNIYDYKLVSDIAISGANGLESAENITPVLADVSSLDGFDSGDFDNNVEGTGSGIKPVVTTAKPADNNALNNGQNGSVSTVEPGSNTVVPVVVIAIVAVVVAAIVVLVVLKSVQNKKNK